MENSPLDKINRNGKIKGPLVIDDIPCITNRDDIGKDEIDICVARRPAPLEKRSGTEDFPESGSLVEAAVDRLVYFREEIS